MCGICGFTGYRQDQKTVIERMMKAIEHRGPDSEGSFCREKITLGFRRLSIIDLEDGQQPMESADGNLHIVFNGEIYDYKELRAELEASGISFCTHSDTEVLVNTIQQYGEKALDKLRGIILQESFGCTSHRNRHLFERECTFSHMQFIVCKIYIYCC